LVTHRQLHALAHLALEARDLTRIDPKRACVCELVRIRPDARIVRAEGLELPLLVAEPRQHAPLDVRQVANDELAAARRGDDSAERVACQLHHVVVDEVGIAALHRADAFFDFLGRHLRSREVLGLQGTTCPAAGALRATELEQPADTAVLVRPVDRALVLRGARRRRGEPHADQFLYRLGQLRIFEPLLERRGLHVRKAHAVLREQVHEHLVTLRRALDVAVRQLAGDLLQLALRLLRSCERSARMRKVNEYATVVDRLIEEPQFQLARIVWVVPGWQLLRQLAQRSRVVDGILDELLPFIGMRFARRAAQLRILRARLAEQIDQRLAVALLRLEPEYLAELPERARQSVRIRLRHRAAPALDRDVEERGEPVLELEHAPIERRVVGDEYRLGIIESLRKITRDRSRPGYVPPLHGLVFHGPGDEHHL